MNVVPVEETVDVLRVRTALRRSGRAPRRVGVAAVGRVGESERRGVGENVRVEIVKVEIRQRRAGGKVKAGEPRGKLLVVELAEYRGFRSQGRIVLREFRDDPDIGNVHHQK